MNTFLSVSKSYDNGFRLFEVDIRLTKDNQLVCVNGWSKKTFERLGYHMDQYDKEGLLYDEFMCKKYHNQYETLDFIALLEQLSVYQDIRVILDMGKPTLNKLSVIIKKLKKSIKKTRKETYILRVQTPEAVEYIQKQRGFSCEIAYYIPSRKEWEKQNITPLSVAEYCMKYQISLVTLPKEACEKEIIEELKRYPLELCVFSYDTLGEVLQVLELGVDIVGTSFLEVNNLKELTIPRQLGSGAY